MLDKEALDHLTESYIQLSEYEYGIAVARRRITLDPRAGDRAQGAGLRGACP